MSICSNCKQELRKKARFCNNCGEKVNSYKISSASGDTEKNEIGMANCPYCKEEIRADSHKPGIFEFSTLGLPDFEETSLMWFSYDNELIYYKGNEETKLHPSDEDWERLWEIMEQIHAWEWDEKYEKRNVFDGNSWSVTVKYKDKYLKCSGSNDYPYGFKQFSRGISSLIDCCRETKPEKVEKDWIEEGHKHYKEGRYGDALACYKHVAGGYRRQCLYLNILRKNKGICYIKLEEYDNAINWYYKWLKYDPNNEYALKAKAEVESLKKQLMTSSSNPIEPEMVYIEGGIFQMGNNYGPGYESPEHEVTVSSFYIGKYKVTNREYKAYNSTHSGCGWGDDWPVESVNWYNAVGYCEWLSSKTGKNYRLPTEAEWEYACRAGSKTAYYWGDSINYAYEYCWTYMDTFMNTNPVGQKLPNALGLYDMSGNVGEWCSDWYGHYPSYPDYPQINPTGPDTGSYRVYRGISLGGKRHSMPDPSRSGERNCYDPGDIDENIGFRLVRTP